VDKDQKSITELPPQNGSMLSWIPDQHKANHMPSKQPLLEALPRTGAPLPLSFGQQHLWSLDQQEPEAPRHNVPAAARISGPLDVPVLERSLNEVVRRHEVLRTTFASVSGQPVQIIAPTLSLSLPTIDVRDFQAGEPEKAVQRLRAAELQRPFDLARGPLIRAALLRTDEQEHVLLLTMHQIIVDYRSMAVLFREVASFYEALKAGRAAHLAELPVQYADYAAWQRQWLQGPVLDSLVAYWRDQLTGAPLALDLPISRPGPPVRTFRSATRSFMLPPALAGKLNDLSQQEGATPFMTLLAAFQALLARYSGQTDVVVGASSASRSRPELEPLIGPLANTLALRTSLEGDPSFRALLGRVRDVTVQAHAHQDLPFSLLAETLQLERTLVHSRFPQVTFDMHSEPPVQVELTDLRLNTLPLEGWTAGSDLALVLTSTERGLQGSLEYNADLFDGASIDRLAGHYQTLLEGVVTDHERRITDLPLLTPGERQQLLLEWNATEADYPHDRCIHQLFEEQVERTPDAVALTFGRMHVTYRELNVWANQIARTLRRRGVGPEVLVGLCVERSPAMVAGLLGVLKAGGAYVPLDPSYPAERLAYLVRDSQAVVLITEEHLSGALPTQEMSLIYLDRDQEAIRAESADNLRSSTTPDNLAYVIYTSGSTGRPKGVMVPHRGLCNVITSKIRTYGVRPDSRVLQFVSLSFDVSAAEVFTALVAGARLCLGTPEELLPGPSLVELLREQAITTIMMPPSVLAVLPSADLPALESIVVGGESCPPELVARWSTGRRFFNTYGPTEASICNTITLCDAEGGPPPIGRPIANTQIYLLDGRLQPVPVGVPGELFIGGVGLARGYHRRPALTAERFIPNPFAEAIDRSPRSGVQPGVRLYRTGDMARYRPDGCIEFVGRKDEQVKIRGFRIEPGEIEAALEQHPSVRQAVVLGREDAPGEKRLVAYVVPRPGQECTPKTLRTFLRHHLPEHMVPQVFVLLDALPLTSNGKVDRHALPHPEASEPSEDDDMIAPRSSIEEELAAIWTDLLSHKRIGSDDSFFDVGGHSLLVTQLAIRVRERFGVELPRRSFFETPTLSALSQLVAAALGSDATSVAARKGVDWAAEARLDPAICPDQVRPADVADPKAIFITGASGFLGAFLLHELLEQTEAEIYCLVRARDAGQGHQRIRAHLATSGLWEERHQGRIIPVVGDLSEPQLGLADEDYNHLASRVDVIYHSGSLVNFIYPYQLLKAANVLGTQEVLRLASETRRKLVHFVSTLAVFLARSKSPADSIDEEDAPDDVDGLADGYAQSKWVAERLIMQARARGLPVSIYRPARIAGHSRTGRSNGGDFLSRLIKGCIQMGSAPDWDMVLDMAPVDFVSKAIIYLSRQTDTVGRAFHLMNSGPLSWSDLVAEVRRIGYPLQLLPYEKWRAALFGSVAKGEENALEPLLPLFEEEQGLPQGIPFAHKVPRFECQRTLGQLADAGIICPPADWELLGTYLAYFVRSGLLDAPQSDSNQHQLTPGRDGPRGAEVTPAKR